MMGRHEAEVLAIINAIRCPGWTVLIDTRDFPPQRGKPAESAGAHADVYGRGAS